MMSASARRLYNCLDATRSMRDLDRLAGLGEGHVAQLISGEKGEMSYPTARKLAAVLGSTPEWLLDGRGAAPAPAVVRAAVDATRAAYLRARKVTRSVAARRSM